MNYKYILQKVQHNYMYTYWQNAKLKGDLTYLFGKIT